MQNKLFLLLGSCLLGVSSTFSFTNINFNSNAIKADEEEYVSNIPYSITHQLYKYASIVGDNKNDVDTALLSWYSDNNNLKSLRLYENEPVQYDENILRECKDSFYVFVYLQDCMLTSTVNMSSKLDAIRTSIDCVVGSLNYSKDYFITINEDPTQIESIYNDLKGFYDLLISSITDYENYYTFTYYEPIEHFIKDAKYNFNQVVNTLNIGYDSTNNNYALAKLFANYYSIASKTGVDNIYLEEQNKIFDEVLYDENKKVELLFETTYLDFSTDEIQSIIDQGLPLDEQQLALKPYYEKFYKETFLRILQFCGIYDTYSQYKEFTIQFINNCGPALYKFLDLFDALINDDPANLFIIFYDIKEDLKNLLFYSKLPDPSGTDFFGIDCNLSINQKDLKFEKYLASVKLGQVIYGYEWDNHLQGYLGWLEEINNITILDPSYYEAGVEEINNCFTNAYKELNIYNVSTYKSNLDVMGNDYAANLVTSKDDKFIFTSSKSTADEPHDAFNRKLNIDYKDSLSRVEIYDFVLSLKNDATNEIIETTSDPFNIVTYLYQLQNRCNVKVYYYDPATDEAIALEEENDEEFNYFTINNDNLILTIKNTGVYCVACINRFVENDINSLNDEINDLSNQIATLNQTIANKNATIESLQAQIQTLQNDVATLTEKVTELTATNQAQKATIENLNNELNRVKTELNEKVVEVENLSKDLNNKNILNIIFIILAALLAISTIVFVILYLKKKKEN